MKNVKVAFKDLLVLFQTCLISCVLGCSGVNARDFHKLSKGQMQKVRGGFFNTF